MATRVRVLLPVLAAAALLAVPAANAGLIGSTTNVLLPTCGATSYPFVQFGDFNAYYGFANNGFESGSNGWSLTKGASVAPGNEPWFVNGSGSHSLTLSAGASATSPGFCINLLDPAMRMFERGSAGGDLRVQVLFRGLTGNLTGILDYGEETGTGAWTPSGRIGTGLALPLATAYAQIRVTSVSGTWQVDDLFEDPSVCLIG